MRIKRGNVAMKKHKKLLKATRGFRGSSSRLFRVANQQRMKALKYAYHDRKNKKRFYRGLWISRINASVRKSNVNYAYFICHLKYSTINLNRKWLSQISVRDSESFTKLPKNISQKA